MTYKVVIRKSVKMIQPQRPSFFVAIGVGQGDAFFLDSGIKPAIGVRKRELCCQEQRMPIERAGDGSRLWS